MQPALVVAIVAAVVAALAIGWDIALAQRIRRLTAIRGEMGKMAAAGDFVGIAQAVQARLDELASEDERLRADDAALAERLTRAVRHLGIVRFDALPGDVGENSFAVALLDDHGSGFVLTSMYGRGAYRLYAKPIVDAVAELVLTDEETAACMRALTGTGMAVVSGRRPRRDGV
jgi:hypothetical protein